MEKSSISEKFIKFYNLNNVKEKINNLEAVCDLKTAADTSNELHNCLKEINPDSSVLFEEIYNIKSLSTFCNGSPLKHYLENYMDLRKQQNEAWAQETVKEGINLLREGQIEKAIKKYTNAIEISPICADAFVARGAALANLEDYKKAITDFKIALKMNPDHPNAKKYLETTKEKKKLKKQEKKALMKGDYVMEIDAPTTALNLIVSEENNSKNKFKSNSLSTEVEGNEKNRKYVKRLRSDDGY